MTDLGDSEPRMLADGIEQPRAFELQGAEPRDAEPQSTVSCSIRRNRRTDRVPEVLQSASFCLELLQELELLPEHIHDFDLSAYSGLSWTPAGAGAANGCPPLPEQPRDSDPPSEDAADRGSAGGGLGADRDALLQGSASRSLRSGRKPEQIAESPRAAPEQRDKEEGRRAAPERHDRLEFMPIWSKDMKETVARKKSLEAAARAETSAGLLLTTTSGGASTRAVAAEASDVASSSGNPVSRHVLTCDTLASYAPRAPSSSVPVSGRPSSRVRRLIPGSSGMVSFREAAALSEAGGGGSSKRAAAGEVSDVASSSRSQVLRHVLTSDAPKAPSRSAPISGRPSNRPFLLPAGRSASSQVHSANTATTVAQSASRASRGVPRSCLTSGMSSGFEQHAQQLLDELMRPGAE